MKCRVLLFLLISFSGLAQVQPTKKETLSSKKVVKDMSVQTQSPNVNSTNPNEVSKRSVASDTIATIDLYKIRNISGLETQVDTSLSIQKYYAVNYLRKDIFGLLPFANDGQAYNVLDFTKIRVQPMSQFGFSAREFVYQQPEDIHYYKVPTAFSEAYFRSAIKQGQNLDVLFTTNTSEQLNFFVGYKGLRSLGSYIHELSSVGNFKIGASYDAKSKAYQLQTHITFQDITVQENGGITDLSLFESNSGIYTSRERLNVYFRNATNLYKGIRTYVNQQYNFIRSEQHAIWLKHQFQYEYKTNLFTQSDSNPENYFFSEGQVALPQDRISNYFGSSYASQIRDKVRNQNIFNQLSLSYDNQTLGELLFSVAHTKYTYEYNSVVLNENGGVLVPHQLKDDVVTLGGAYVLNTSKVDAKFHARQSVIGAPLSELHAEIDLEPFHQIVLKASYDFISKMPNMNQQLFQSDYVRYNWFHQFNNEKYNMLQADLQTPWVNATFNYRLITDKVYFSNDSTAVDYKGRLQQLITTPKQFGGVINYIGLKLQKEIQFGKFALDNTFLYQATAQDQNIINVPTFTTRNTFYYTDYWFKRALFLQTGITFQYFTKYYANGYNPVLSDFYVQTDHKIGVYPVFDFFINAKIRTARIYFNLEHFNAKIGQSTYYSAPNYPYREMIVRLGIVWDFFN